MRELEGRVALVTGASRNIGRAIALELAGAGAALVLNAHRSQAELEALAAELEAAGTPALALLADLSDPAEVERMGAQAMERFGRLDILVNNAALRELAPLEEIDLARWRRVTAVSLDGAYLCVRAFLAPLKASGHGTIVNIGGLSGHSGAAGRPHVAAAKAGLAGLSRALAQDLAPFGVTVNCVVPGLIDTLRSASSGPGGAHAGRRAPLVGRRGTPADVAHAVRFLCGPGARYITGATLHVNGGAYLA